VGHWGDGVLLSLRLGDGGGAAAAGFCVVGAMLLAQISHLGTGGVRRPLPRMGELFIIGLLYLYSAAATMG
jgi:hypothetical protein